MATTTNYGWTTPDDTALVKDGASAIRTLGSSVDTTTKNLNPSTTLGDIEYRSSTANTNTRLGIGSTGNILTVTGGVPVWAAPAAGGAYTSIASGSLSSTATDLTSISQSYTDLYLVVTGAYFITTNSQCVFRYNSDSNANYNSWFALLTSATPIPETDQTYTQTSRNNVGTSANASTSILYIRNYATTSAKQITATFSTITDAGVGNYWSFGSYESSTAISEISIRSSNGTSVFGGGTYVLYGVK
jgi:hypothetical protein